jgi:hypothetical protein
MDSSVKKQTCSKQSCKVKSSTKNQNGKGDKPRPFSKNQYNSNYESINWKKR